MIRNRAFTVPELLAVVAIVILLLALLMPSLGKARLNAKRTICLTRQRSIGLALHGYATENKSLYPLPQIGGSDWADAYGLRDDYPYTGATNRAALGLGLLVTNQMLPAGGLEVIHCPTLDNREAAASGHCMDIPHTWGYVGSGYIEFPRHRIIGGFNYRGTSYWHVNKKLPRRGEVGSGFVMMIDTPDFRFRGQQSQYNAHGGYNIIYGDGGGYFFADQDYSVDGLAQGANGRVDGRGAAKNDELIYKSLADVR